MKRPPSARKSPPKRRGAKKATSISVRSEKQITAICARFHLEGPILTFRDVRASLNRKYGVRMSVGTVYRMAHGHNPKSVELRRALEMVKPYPDLFAWPVRDLARSIRERITHA
jgi:hypothetical protein